MSLQYSSCSTGSLSDVCTSTVEDELGHSHIETFVAPSLQEEGITAAAAAAKKGTTSRKEKLDKNRTCYCPLRQILLFPLWVVAGILLSIPAGPIFFWNWFWLDPCFQRLFAKYQHFLHGVILESKVVARDEFSYWYGITYQYQYGLEGEIWARERHYVKLPDCIPDDYTSTATHPPENLQPGKSVRLVMIPGEPASALPGASMRAMAGNLIGPGEYIILPPRATRSCLNVIETTSMVWWFAVALIGGLLYALLPEAQKYVSVLVSVSMVVILFLLLGPPVAYYCYCRYYQEIVFGGEKKRSTS